MEGGRLCIHLLFSLSLTHTPACTPRPAPNTSLIGWGYEWGACASVPFLLVNHQPLHHLFPALHHSRLPSLVPLVREFYPGLLADEPGLGAFVQAFREMYETVFSSTAGERAWAHEKEKDARVLERERERERERGGGGGGHENERDTDEREEEDERDEL